MARERTRSKIDLFLLVAFPITAAILTEVYQFNLFISTLLFFGVPSTYLSIRNPSLIKKAFIFSTIFFVPMVVIIDHPAYLDSTWFVPNSAFRFLRNSIPIEDVVWTFLWLYFAVIFWEYFLDISRVKDRFSKNIRYLIILLSSLLVGFFLFYFINPEILYAPYFYLKMGVVFVVFPMGAVLLRFPRLIRKVFLVGLYFFMVSFLAEYVALRQNQWHFSGEHYLGLVNFFNHPLPLDEIIFWWALGVPGLICWYEFFADDRK